MRIGKKLPKTKKGVEFGGVNICNRGVRYRLVLEDGVVRWSNTLYRLDKHGRLEFRYRRGEPFVLIDCLTAYPNDPHNLNYRLIREVLLEQARIKKIKRRK